MVSNLPAFRIISWVCEAHYLLTLFGGPWLPWIKTRKKQSFSFLCEALKTHYWLPLFFLGCHSFSLSGIKVSTSSFSFFLLRFRLLQNRPFARLDTIHEVIIHPHLISVRRNETSEASCFLTVNRVISFIYTMPQGFLYSVPIARPKSFPAGHRWGCGGAQREKCNHRFCTQC